MSLSALSGISGVGVQPRPKARRKAAPGHLMAANSDAQAAAPSSLWALPAGSGVADARAALMALLARVMDSPPAQLYVALEAGVPTQVVQLLADAFNESLASFLSLFEISETTFHRKEEGNQPLPAVASHRVMGFLRSVGKLWRLLQDSGDVEQLARFDLEAWVSQWIRSPLPEFNGKTPAQMLSNPEGQRAVEDLLERMRGGLPA